MEELEFELPSGRLAAITQGPADGRPVVMCDPATRSTITRHLA